MADSSASMGARFCRAARRPLAMAFPRMDWEKGSGFKGLPTAAGLLGVGVGDAEASSRQSVLVVDDRPGQVNQAAVLDKKLHPMGGKFLVPGFPGGNFHGIGHSGASAGFNENAEPFAFGIGLADDLGDMFGRIFGKGYRGQCGRCHVKNLRRGSGLSMNGAERTARLVLTQGTPAGAVLDDPVKKGLFKADIVALFFAFNPFMAQDFFTLS